MFKLIELPYSKDGLNPVISAQTLDFHHGKHLQAYVDNLQTNYLDYQNRRPAHLSALWQILDWKIIEERYTGSK